MHREFSARDVPAQRKLKYWEHATSSLIFPVEIRLRCENSFAGTAASWDLGSMSLICLQTEAISYTRRDDHVRHESGDYVLVSFAARAAIGFRQDGIDLLCRRHQFFIERTHHPSEFTQTGSNEVWTLKLPVSSLKRHVRSIEPFYLSPFDCGAGVGGLLLDLVRQIPCRHDTMSALTAEGIGQTLVELLVLAMEADERALGSGQSAVRRGHLVRIERFVRQNLQDAEMAPDTIARACNISVRYLHALFKGSGVSVNQWIRELRLESCRIQICEAHHRQSLGEIAHRWGFRDQCQFSRSFRMRFGMTPKDMRAEALAGIATRSADLA